MAEHMHAFVSINRRRLVILTLLVLPACGEDGTTSPSDAPPAPIDVTGSWISPDETAGGVPRSRYDITQSGTALTGEAFWIWQGALEHVGSLTGTIDARGSAEWTTVLDDNGWDGTESVEARFSGVEARPAIGEGGGTVAGTWEWRAPDGSLREGGDFRLDRRPIVVPAPGSGTLGDAGIWRGAMLYVSPAGCHTAGFVMALSLSLSGQTVVGSASAQPHPRGAALPDSLDDWFGYMNVDISGPFEPAGSDTMLSLTFSGDVSGSLIGTLNTGPDGTQYLGTFRGANVCMDASGAIDEGTFIYNSERPIAP